MTETSDPAKHCKVKRGHVEGLCFSLVWDEVAWLVWRVKLRMGGGISVIVRHCLPYKSNACTTLCVWFEIKQNIPLPCWVPSPRVAGQVIHCYHIPISWLKPTTQRLNSILNFMDVAHSYSHDANHFFRYQRIKYDVIHLSANHIAWMRSPDVILSQPITFGRISLKCNSIQTLHNPIPISISIQLYPSLCGEDNTNLVCHVIGPIQPFHWICFTNEASRKRLFMACAPVPDGAHAL